jgi:hypothetical protein
MKVNIRNFHKGPNERKVEVTVEKWDTYSMDHTAALLILPLLLQLKQTKHGVPSGLVTRNGGDMDNNLCFDFIAEDENAVFDKLCDQWDEILDKMIWSFQQIVDDSYDSKYHHGHMKLGWKPIEITHPTTRTVSKAYEMVDENPGEHWYDHVGHTLHEERIQEGLELFGKYYRNLWD